MVASKEKLNAAARRWISHGGVPPAPPDQLAATCDQIIRTELAVSARKALHLAERFAASARKIKSHVLNLAAARGLARTLHVSGKHRDALGRYKRARVLATKLKDPLSTARIDRAMADVYMYLNRYSDAQAASKKAIRTFKRIHADADAVQAEVNLANLYHRQDRHRDAEIIYARAEVFFSKAKNPLAKARVSYNRANVLVQMFDWDSARESYRSAEQIYIDHKFDLDANDARYGLAYIELLSDRFADALTQLSQCERAYREGGDPRGAALCVLDLSEAYLGLNLYTEALATARRARTAFRKLKLRYETSKASLYMAYALAGQGRKSEARILARQTQTAFAKERNLGMAAATRLLQAQLVRTRSARTAGLKTARREFARAQVPIWSTLCDLQMLAEPSPPRSVVARLARLQTFRRVPHWSALYDTIKGEQSLAKGRTREARDHWRRAASTLEQARRVLPPLELRAGYLAGRTDPYRKLIKLDADSDAISAAIWAERLKTAGIWSLKHVLEAPDSESRRLLDEWSALSSQLSGIARQIRISAGSNATRAVRQAERSMRSLEQRSAYLVAQLEARGLKHEVLREDLATELKRTSMKMPIVIWHVAESDLYAFVIQNGNAQTHVWSNGTARLNDELRRSRFFTERHMIANRQSSGDKADSSEQSFWQELGEWLWQPLDLQPTPGGRVLLIPDGQLFALPFSALRVSDKWLGDMIHPVVSPSFRHYLSARRVRVPKSGIEIYDAGGEELMAAHDEIDALVNLMGGRDYRLHRPARREHILKMPSSRLWHFAGHANFRVDNPFYSTLQLEDGPVFAADLRTRRVSVELATISACHSAGGSGAPGEEYSGLVRSILEMGSRSVVAALWPVSDRSTATWMSEFYTAWFGGKSIPESVQVAQRKTRERWAQPYHWAAFALFGSEGTS